MARLVVSADHLGEEVDHSKPSYWRAENHVEDNYLRVEKWLPDVQEYMLSRVSVQVPLTYEMGTALLRYREDLKMFAALQDQTLQQQRALEAKQKAEQETGAFQKFLNFFSSDDKDDEESSDNQPPVEESLHKPEFLDEHWQTAMATWNQFPNKSKWLAALQALMKGIDEALAQMPKGGFVKLSVRSPKDSVFDLSTVKPLIRQKMAATLAAGPSDPALWLSEEVNAIRWAAWQAMRVTTGEEAVKLLVRSDRVYLDILQHELFAQKNQGKFNLAVHAFEFVDDLDPNWEFRGFVSNGQRTALTAYSPWVYDRRLIENKDAVWRLIEDLWNRVQPRIASENYSIDFAVSSDLTQCWIVELNNFLPPLAGSGLFNMQDQADQSIIFNGPFEFRIKETPITERDFERTYVDKQTQQITRMIMKPCPDDIMAFAHDCRSN
eukprot:TRINITY_DN9200_c0_g1_i1.p1 TRINITY_DN9200_c0_g1~~TRINITY_DN9200_c0_g1_i1.p1  ORF type:complete len:437 (+),score=94.55 TRINITY_DN9200_c0_g1_i1:114-1424(+)